MKNLFSIMSNLQTHYHFKLDLIKVDQYTGGKWLIYGTKHRKDSQLQTPQLIYVYMIYCRQKNTVLGEVSCLYKIHFSRMGHERKVLL